MSDDRDAKADQLFIVEVGKVVHPESGKAFIIPLKLQMLQPLLHRLDGRWECW